MLIYGRVVMMNINSEHVTVEGLRINEEICSLFDRYKIVTYADLAREIKNKNREIFENYFLISANSEFNKIFDRQQRFEKVYDEYVKIMEEKSKYNLEAKDIDKMVKISDLPIFKLSDALTYRFIHGMPRSCRYKINALDFDGYNMAYVKDKMNDFIVRNDEAIPRIICHRTGIGEEKYNSILASINFYDRYIETLLEKYSDKENPFYFMQQEKLEIVRRNRKEIFNYLSEAGYELVIGDLKNAMKYLDYPYSKAVGAESLYRREEIIANYVTFDEALEITSPKVLNKFIVPYGKR